MRSASCAARELWVTSTTAWPAVALANDPPLLLADEPTGEVDEANEQLILELLRGRAESGRAVVIVTHSTRAALEADRIVHLNDGRIVDA